MRAETTVRVVEMLGSLAVVATAVWQRLTFERWLDAPPPLLSLCAWIAICAFLGVHLAQGDSARRGAAIFGSLASALHLWAMGFPDLQAKVDVEMYRFALARYLSTTWHGFPLPALVTMTGVLSCAFLCMQSAKVRVVQVGLTAIVLIFGATTVLGYATGSPWPFGS